LRDMWPRLDEFEGTDYRCEVTEAILSDGTTTPCAVYAVDVAER